MKNSILLLVAGTAFAVLAWAFWHLTGEYGVTILVVIAIAALASRSVRHRDREAAKTSAKRDS